ncbi:hypothetical protein CLV59_105439 [Chitinophaga dinghuensis]|uniref:Uncharacterized protein n=1 Tax=Chitinophaga dinghuensis TaxID=1539050 RepID=A0A327VYW5_9BACT|nr:hypothetical protein [Chitinophaga dinghuensis]RAJ80330.1 hypothetical protein CLV59_105439 [Chitinophaga dinghuensis]
MKQPSQKKLQLGRIKLASLSAQPQAIANAITVATCTLRCVDGGNAAANTSMGAPICSIDSCRF